MTFDPVTAKLIFLEAIALPSSEARKAYVEEACAGDTALRREVEELLAHHESLGSFLEADPDEDGEPSPWGPGTRLANYELCEEIGEGAFGIVYRAQQTFPVRREVALKILKAGMGTREIVSRFEAERQALALMDHPNIARVYDGGSTPEGRPYFVMELVRGVPITTYCDDASLSIEERLALFTTVCGAVQHAHQKGVIHRDLKPSNVLVSAQDGHPTPKVIDFGVAKALGPGLTEETFHTRIAQMIGTPLYMSPEQAELGEPDVDTRSDVYSLGVLLYELLTGTTPFTRERMCAATYDELRRILRDEDPPTPSARLTLRTGRGVGAATSRRADPRSLARTVHGDLDWIVMKALEKDRQRRYATASALAADVERHLRNEPVEARPPSRWYRAKKLVRRNRAGVTVALLVLVILALSAGAIGWVLRDRAVRQTMREKGIEVALSQVEASVAAGRLPEAREAIQRAEGFAAGGTVAEDLERTVREWHEDLDMLTRLKQAHLARADPREDPLDSSRADRAYREAFHQYGMDPLTLGPAEVGTWLEGSRIREGIATALDDWLTCCEPEADADRLRTHVECIDTDPWRRRVREAMRIRDRAVLQMVARKHRSMGFALHAGGDRVGAIAAFRKAIEIAPDDMGTWQELGRALQNEGRAEEAVAAFRKAQDIDPQDPWPPFLLGNALRALGRYEEAIDAYTKVLQLNPDNTGAHTYMGLALLGLGRTREAVDACRKALDGSRKEPILHGNLGLAHLANGQIEQAIASCRTAIDLDPGYEVAYATLGRALLAQGRWEAAVEACRTAIELGVTEEHGYLDPFHVSYLAHNPLEDASVHRRLAWVLATVPVLPLRDPKQAVALAERAVGLARDVGLNWRVLGAARLRSGDAAGAIGDLRRSMNLQDGGIGYDWILMAIAYAHLGRPEDARPWYDRSVAWAEEHAPDDEELRRFLAEASDLLGTGLQDDR